MSATRNARPSRFVKQPHDYSCGPTAILNCMKWVGLPVTLECDYSDLIDDCEAEPDGTSVKVFDRILRRSVCRYAQVRRVYRPKLCDVERWIQLPQRVVVLCYLHTSSEYSEGHYMLITERVAFGKLFRCINDSKRKSVILRDRSTIKRYLRNRNRAKENVPVAWFLEVVT